MCRIDLLTNVTQPTEAFHFAPTDYIFSSCGMLHRPYYVELPDPTQCTCEHVSLHQVR